MPERQLEIHLLGSLQVMYGDVPLTTLNTARLQALFAYLVLHRRAPQTRQNLAFLFWPDSSEAQARTNLRNLLHQLRHALPEAERFLFVATHSVQWRPNAPFRLDVARFESALEASDLQAAIDLYPGDLLPGRYDDWIITERERLRNLYLGTLERYLHELEASRAYAAAIVCARRILQADPVREEAHRSLIRLHALNGDRAAALHAYHTCASLLRRELDVEPSPATRALYEQVTHISTDVAVVSPTGAISLVGRQSEWSQLLEAWRAASTGQPRLALISGEAGIGKTRLAEELQNWAARQGLPMATANCFQAEGALPFAPIAAWLRSRPLPPLDDAWLVEVSRLLPEVRAARPDLPPAPPMTEAWQRQRLFEALARAAAHGSSSALWVLEDGQWCDRDSLEWLHYFLRFQPTPRVLILATKRVEEHSPDQPLENLRAGLGRSGQLIEIGLTPLSEAETFQLAEQAAGRPLDPALSAPLFQGSEGNPLFVIEMVRAGLSKPGPWTAEHGQPMLHAPLPPKVRAVIEARLGQLSPLAHELAGVAAVIGRAFNYAVLQRASAAEEEGVVRGLDELWQRRIVREQGTEVYDFAHARIRDVAYAELSAARRRWLHRKVAEALEAVYAATPDVVSGQIAAHYEQAGDKEKAIIFYRRAAGAARRVFANAEAGAALVSALALADPDQAEQRLRLYEDLADIRVLMGQGEAALEAYQHALAHTVASESVMKARLHRKMGAAQQVNGHHEAALLECVVAESALGQPEPAEDTAWWQEWAQIQIQRCGILYWTNQWPEVARIIEQVRPILERYSTPALRLEFYHTVAQHQLRGSRYVISDELIAHKREVVAAAHELENPGEIASHIFSLGFCLLWKGEMEAAEEHLTSALRLAEQIGHRLIQLQTKTYLSILARKRNQVEQAQRLAEHCLVEAEAMQRREYVSVAQATLAWAAWREKRRAEAQTLAQAALDGWRAWTVPYPFWHLALWPLIDLSARQEDLTMAIDHARLLLESNQQPLPDSLSSVLEDAFRAWEHSQPDAARQLLGRAVGMAKDLGYL